MEGGFFPRERKELESVTELTMAGKSDNSKKVRVVYQYPVYEPGLSM